MGKVPQNSRDAEPKTQRHDFFDLPAPTFGGKQLWTDHVHRAQWRIQKNELTSHYRLLDPANIRRTWGSLEKCQTALDERVGKTEESGVVVVLLHGLMRSRNSMRGLARFLHDQGGYAVANFEYASTRNTLQSHAEALHNVLRGFPSADGFHFVGHSLGNLVIRRLIHLIQNQPADRMIDRFRRMVMLGAPNNGARFAQRFKNNVLFQTVWGKSGDQLGIGWEQLESQLATPPFEFGVIAGVGPISNPLLDGMSDLVVSVEETRLIGAADFFVTSTTHTFIMNNQSVRNATLRFLKSGAFRASGQRQPIVQSKLSRDQLQLARES